MDKIVRSRHIQDVVVHCRAGNSKIVGVDKTLIVLECEILDPIGSIGEGMVWRRRRVGEGVPERVGNVWLSAGRIKPRVGIGVTTAPLSAVAPGLMKPL